MSSKLFHTIVAVGITLGAASAVGCAATPDGESTTATGNALAASDTPANGNAADAGPDADAFCDAVWPTTKGGLHHHPLPQCIDPTGACAHLADGPFECSGVDAHDVCTDDLTTASVCIDGAWACKPGRKPLDSCTCFTGEKCDPTATPPTTSTSAQ
jgi:hypothetical protein